MCFYWVFIYILILYIYTNFIYTYVLILLLTSQFAKHNLAYTETFYMFKYYKMKMKCLLLPGIVSLMLCGCKFIREYGENVTLHFIEHEEYNNTLK